ncbi:MFS monosaccharide transporter [Crepidotus variabilis]|uniref:MFS monosaccharide transporter n=1 Tax=Crepidotus variabilis TaxID=179855 RepID=A0A9P6EIV0_9AGAR|nr:MFS monosaccharide transporter [Crepidotus variabilis]
MRGRLSAASSYSLGTVGSKASYSGIAMTTFSAVGGILFGYETGVLGGIKEMKIWLRQFGHPATNLQESPSGYMIPLSSESFLVSILSAGTVVGALLSAPAADHLGRKWAIVAACVVFAAGAGMQTAARTIPLFAIGRLFAGVGVGCVSSLIPMYQAECAPKWIRGAVITIFQLCVTIGLLLAAIINNVTKNYETSAAYMIPLAVQFGWAFLLGGGMLFLPESPRWLIKRGRLGDAADSLSRLMGCPPNSPEVMTEIDDISLNYKAELAVGATSYRDCFRSRENRMLFRTVTGILMQACQQLTGINFIFYYGTTFFKNSGLRDPFLISVITNTVNVTMTLPAIWCVERWGRRRLMIVGSLGMSLCEYIVAVVGVTISVDNIAGQQVLIAFVCTFIAFFAATWGPISWVVTPELFPLELRAKGMSLVVASNWIINFALGYATPYLVNSEPGSAGLGSKVFFLWGSTCFISIFFTFICVPETKGLSLEQIDVMYRETTPIRSLEYRRQLRVEEEVIALSSHGRFEKRSTATHSSRSTT